MVKKTKKNEIERRLLLERGLTIVLTGMLAMSACGTSMVAFAADGTALTNEGQQKEEVVSGLVVSDMNPSALTEGSDVPEGEDSRSGMDAESEEATENAASENAKESYSVAFAIGDASVDCNGATITGQQAVAVPAEEDLVFTVAPHDGFTVDDVSLQLLSEGVLDVLEPNEAAEGAHYTVAADKLADGMAIVVDTVVIETEAVAPEPDSAGDPVLPPFTGRTPSVNVKDIEKVYDGQSVSVNASAEKNGTTLSYYTDGMSGWSSESPRFTDAGTYSVLVKATNPNDPEADVVTAHVTVKPAPVVIKVRDAEKTLGSADPAFEGVIEGLMPGDEIGSVVYYRLNSGTEEAGTYTDALSALVQHRNGNYAYTVTPGTFTIKHGSEASAQGSTNDSAALGGSDQGQPAPVEPNLVAEFAQGEGMQRFTEGVVEPIATLLGVRSGDLITVSDDETPLAALEDDAQDGFWLRLWVLLGMLIAAAGAAFVVLRRVRPAWFMTDDIDEAYERDPNLEETGALPALDALRR